MKLYIDCTNGISGDMVLAALMELGADGKLCQGGVESLRLQKRAKYGNGGEHHHSRSYKEIRKIIEEGDFSAGAKEIALAAYEVIAEAEARVHGETTETVHFHEVGRDKAIENIVGVAIALDDLRPEAIYCSPVYDGKGSIICSHGEIPVPVPAVAAMMENCDYEFVTADVDTEMVTPTGLALLIGIGAVKGEAPIPGTVITTGLGKGTRDTGREGLRIYMYQVNE